MAPAWIMGPRCALRLLALFLVVYLQTADCQIIGLNTTVSSTTLTTTTATTTTTRTPPREERGMEGWAVALIVLYVLTLVAALFTCIWGFRNRFWTRIDDM